MADATQRTGLRAILDIRREELPLALLMLAYFFLVITTFWILKPLKKIIFIGYYGKEHAKLFGLELGAAQTELMAKLLNVVLAYCAVIVFSALSRRFVREQLTFIFGGFFAVLLLGYTLVLTHPTEVTVWSFYVFGDLYNTVMVATFFAFLNDSIAPSAARRLYGPIVFGGVAGGVFGSSFVRLWIERMSMPSWMFICIGITGVVLLLAFAAGRIVRKGLSGAVPKEAREAEAEPKPIAAGNPATEGGRLVLRSRYLLAIVAIVALYEIISQTLDFQYTATVVNFLQQKADQAKQFASVYALTNVSSLVMQLLFTSFVMTRFRLTVALLITPAAILTSSTLFMFIPLLWPGSLLSIADNSLNYSINQSAKEALYTPTSRNEKYKAKAFIDMLVQRFAKCIAILVTFAATTIFTGYGTVRWLSVFVLGLGAVWVSAAYYGGRRFHELTGDA